MPLRRYVRSMAIILFFSATWIAAARPVEAATLFFNADSPAENASTRNAWLASFGAQPEFVIDFESGFTAGQNVHDQAGLFPGGLKIVDTSVGQAVVSAGPFGGSNPVGTLALAHGELPFLELDFSGRPVDYVAFLDIDQAGTAGTITYLGGATESFSIETTGINGDSAEFFGLFRNDRARIVRIALDASGDGSWALDDIEYGVVAGGACVIPIDCDDANPCTTDSCDAQTGECTNAAQPDGTICDDDNVCTTTSTCVAGTCAQHTAQRCTSGWEPGEASACDPVLGCQLEPGCEPFLEGNLCHPLDPNRAPGTCQYQPTFCQPDGCFFQDCNPTTGLCERRQDERAINCEDPLAACSTPPSGCGDSDCLGITCNFLIPVPNCNFQVLNNPSGVSSGPFLTPETDNPSTCQTGVVEPGVTNSLACAEGIGGNYVTTDCAAEQPFGPPGPCEEYVQNPTTAEPYLLASGNPNPPCCELRPKVCRATDFGLPANTTGYEFSCEATTGDCVATPLPEPGMIGSLGIGIFALAWARRRRFAN